MMRKMGSRLRETFSSNHLDWRSIEKEECDIYSEEGTDICNINLYEGTKEATKTPEETEMREEISIGEEEISSGLAHRIQQIPSATKIAMQHAGLREYVEGGLVGASGPLLHIVLDTIQSLRADFEVATRTVENIVYFPAAGIAGGFALSALLAPRIRKLQEELTSERAELAKLLKDADYFCVLDDKEADHISVLEKDEIEEKINTLERKIRRKIALFIGSVLMAAGSATATVASF